MRLLHQRGQLPVRLILLPSQLLDQGRDPAAVRRGHLVVEAPEGRDRHIAIPPLAECVGESLHLAERLAICVGGETGLEDLERRAQPPRRDPHVVDPLDVARVEDTLGVLGELDGPHRDDPRGGLGVGALGAQIGDRLGLGHEGQNRIAASSPRKALALAGPPGPRRPESRTARGPAVGVLTVAWFVTVGGRPAWAPGKG
jgi:hypothetical protein